MVDIEDGGKTDGVNVFEFKDLGEFQKEIIGEML